MKSPRRGNGEGGLLWKRPHLSQPHFKPQLTGALGRRLIGTLGLFRERRYG